MIESIALGVFVFIALAVAGCRALDSIRAKRREAEAANRERERVASLPRYSGPLWNQHGREVTSDAPHNRRAC